MAGFSVKKILNSLTGLFIKLLGFSSFFLLSACYGPGPAEYAIYASNSTNSAAYTIQGSVSNTQNNALSGIQVIVIVRGLIYNSFSSINGNYTINFQDQQYDQNFTLLYNDTNGIYSDLLTNISVSDFTSSNGNLYWKTNFNIEMTNK